MESDTPAAATVTDSAPVSKEKSLYNDLLDAISEAHCKHPNVSLADALMLLGCLIGSVIGHSFPGAHGVVKVSLLQNIDRSMNQALFASQPAAGNA